MKAAVRADSSSPEASAITEKPQVRFVDVARRVNLPALFPLAGDRTHPRFRLRLRDDGAHLPLPLLLRDYRVHGHYCFACMRSQ